MNPFQCKTCVIIGSCIEVIRARNIQRMILVCDPYFRQNGTAHDLASAVTNCEIFSDIVPDPSVSLAAKGAALVQSFKPDTVVALGGGSAMDTAKAMTYFSGLKPAMIAIPTTSGSGSEVTDFAILTHEGVKHPLVDDALQPDVAILDEKLVQSLPPALIADGGFDLISHSLEALVAKGATPFTDALAEKAFCTAMRDLSSSFSGERSVRQNVHIAATMAGLSFSMAGLGLCHAMSHTLGGAFHIPHGRLNAILLPSVIECNAGVCGDKYAQLSRNLGLSSGTEILAIRALKNAILRLRRNLRLPNSLSECGVSPAAVQEQLPQLVESTLRDPCCFTNPLTPSSDTVRRILLEVAARG